MNQQTCVLFVTQMINILHSGDIESFVDLFLPNAELILPKKYCVGYDAIHDAVMCLYQTYENISIEVERILYQDDVALVQWHWQDKNHLTGEHHETETALVLEFEGRHIKRWREYHAAVFDTPSDFWEP